MMERGSHTLHECRTASEFLIAFEETIGEPLQQVVNRVIAPSAPSATFVVGSLAQGMGSSGSDVDLIVLVDEHSAAIRDQSHIANNARELTFVSESRLLAGSYLKMYGGVALDLSVVITPEIHAVYDRLRRRGPELSEIEIRTLGRLSSGWLLSQTDGYMQRHAAILKDSTLRVYCCTKQYVVALHEVTKATRALDRNDIPLALQHARIGVEATYLAYFASEGFPFLGTKWLAQLGHARGASERLERQPLLAEGVPLLFPQYPTTAADTAAYLQTVAGFLAAMRGLIEEKTLFRIAFSACPQIHRLH